MLFRYSSIWLRHNCHCSQCKQPHSGQKMLDPSTTEVAYKLDSAAIEGSELSSWPVTKKSSINSRIFRVKVPEEHLILICCNFKGSTVKLKWKEDQHLGSIPVEFLLNNSYSDESRRTNFQMATPPYCKVYTLSYHPVS